MIVAGHSQAPTPRSIESGDSGMTLVEVLVVLTLLAAISALVYPSLNRNSAGAEPRTTALQIIAGLRDQRATAILLNERREIIYDAGQRRLMASGGQRIGIIPAGTDVRIEAARRRHADADTIGVIFFPDGSSSGGAITIGSGNASRRISIDWLSGAIKLDEPKP